MKKLSFPLICDALFYSVSIGFLALGILRYFRVSLGVSIALGATFAVAAGCLILLFLYSRRKKKWLSKKEREAREALMLHLTLEKEERVRAALLSAFTADKKEAHCEQEGLLADGELYIPLFTMQPVSADAVALLLRKHGTTPFTLVCNALSPEAEKLLSSFGREAMPGDDVYALFTRTGTTPSPLICAEIPRKTVRRKLRRAFSKRNARPFFMSGIMLLFMSLFTFFPVYYIVTGSVLLISAVLVRALGYA